MSKAGKAYHCTNGGKGGHATKILKCVMFFRCSRGPLCHATATVYSLGMGVVYVCVRAWMWICTCMEVDECLITDGEYMGCSLCSAKV